MEEKKSGLFGEEIESQLEDVTRNLGLKKETFDYARFSFLPSSLFFNSFPSFLVIPLTPLL